MRFFNKSELIAVIVILGLVITATTFNLKASIIRARDAQRRADLKSVANALESYFDSFGFFPPSSDGGKIVACKGENFDSVTKELEERSEFNLGKYLEGLAQCDWGTDSLTDLSEGKTYLQKLPQDPRAGQGYSFLYLSNTKRFQLYAHLEGGGNEEGYSQDIVERGLNCGVRKCNFGLSYGSTPLDMSIEEYEEEIVRESIR